MLLWNALENTLKLVEMQIYRSIIGNLESIGVTFLYQGGDYQKTFFNHLQQFPTFLKVHKKHAW